MSGLSAVLKNTCKHLRLNLITESQNPHAAKYNPNFMGHLVITLSLVGLGIVL